MAKSSRAAMALVIVAACLALPSEVAAQERVVVEERTGEVLRVVGRTVVIRNDLGEVKMYTELPEDVKLFVDGEPAEIGDLQEGMELHAIRWENVPPPIVVTAEENGPQDPPQMDPPRPAAPAHPVPATPEVVYRHLEPALDSAMRFIAGTVTEDSHRLAKPSYRVSVSDSCTLRFDRHDARSRRVPVHVVKLSTLDPERSHPFENTICLQTTHRYNSIAYYELSVDSDWTYSYSGTPILGSRKSMNRLCFSLSLRNSHRVALALDHALGACRSRVGW